MILIPVNECPSSNGENKQVNWRREQCNLAIRVEIIVFGLICLNLVVSRLPWVCYMVYKFPEGLYSVSISYTMPIFQIF